MRQVLPFALRSGHGQVTSKRGIAMSETFGVWELLTRVGHNELGETHLALRRADQQKAVLKRFSPGVTDEASFYGPLKLELSLAAKLAHPSAAAVLEQGEADGVAFAAFEHVDGISLAKLTQRAQATGGWPLSMGRAVELIRPVLDALAAAHALTPPLLHRDLVPQNVLVTCEGRVVLTDFGLGRARLRAGTEATGMRRAYVSPEQARGNATEPRSEVFAAGLLLFELVCGRLPAQGGPAEVITHIATGELDAPLAVNPLLDDAAVAVLERALAVRPEARFASMREFFEALTPWTTGSPAAESLGAWVTRLDGVKLAPLPPAAPKPSPVAPTPNVVTVITEATTRPLMRPIHWVAGSAMGAVIAALVLAPYSNELREIFSRAPAVDAMAAGRPLELRSIPSGAEVYVDGVLEERRTPLVINIPRDEQRHVMLKKQGSGIWSANISNTRRLEVTIATGARSEDRYEGGRPGAKAEVQAPVVPVESAEEAAAPKQEVVFDAEAPPIDVVLTAAHSVKADQGPSLEVAAGAVGAVSEGATIFLSPASPVMGRAAMQRMTTKMSGGWNSGGGAGSFRVLNLFALRVADGAVEVLDLSKPVTFTTAGDYHFFSPTESGDLTSNTAYARVNSESIALDNKNLLRVDQDDSFLIRVLNPKVAYQLEITRADGSNGPLPAVLMSLRPELELTHVPTGAFQSSLRYDGQPMASGQALIAAGKHTFTGARNVWFTILTAQGVVPPKVKLSVRPASAKKLR